MATVAASPKAELIVWLVGVKRPILPFALLLLFDKYSANINALRTETIDVGLLHPPIDAAFLHLHPLQGEKLVVALPQTHPLAQQKQLRLKSLAAEPLILHPRYEVPVLYDQILSLCRTAGFEPHIVHEEAKHQTRVGLVAAGISVTFVPESVQQSGLSSISYRSLNGISPELQLAIA